MFPEKIIDWYLHNKRDLPWRNTKDPYKIWLSEIILQQTRVAQGLPYYERFIAAFPTVRDLALADEAMVMKLWQGLGYYSRARNLHAAAKMVVEEHQEFFPNRFEGLLKLKGVGHYTAAAIASFAFDEKVGVVDGNVFRVMARYFGVFDDISTPKTRKLFQELVNDQVRNVSSALFNQAIMDFGALQCVPQSPNCEQCSLWESCYAFRYQKVSELPVKTKKVKVTDRFFNFLIFEDSANKVQIEQRTAGGIWQQLYQFPLLETTQLSSTDEVAALAMRQYSYQFEQIVVATPEPIIHKLTHQRLFIKFWKLKVAGILENGVTQSELKEYAFPIVIWNFITSHYDK